jgi:hypothetical protein
MNGLIVLILGQLSIFAVPILKTGVFARET